RQRIARPTPFQPVQEPQPPLPIRQRDLARPLNRTQRRARLLPLRQPARQPRNARRLKQRADRNLDPEARPYPPDPPRRQQRMTPERKEVVVDADPGYPEHLGKQRTQHLLLRRARRAIARSRRPQLRRRQRRTVELAVRRQRKPRKLHKRRRNHVV